MTEETISETEETISGLKTDPETEETIIRLETPQLRMFRIVSSLLSELEELRRLIDADPQASRRALKGEFRKRKWAAQTGQATERLVGGYRKLSRKEKARALSNPSGDWRAENRDDAVETRDNAIEKEEEREDEAVRRAVIEARRAERREAEKTYRQERMFDDAMFRDTLSQDTLSQDTLSQDTQDRTGTRERDELPSVPEIEAAIDRIVGLIDEAGTCWRISVRASKKLLVGTPEWLIVETLEWAKDLFDRVQVVLIKSRASSYLANGLEKEFEHLTGVSIFETVEPGFRDSRMMHELNGPTDNELIGIVVGFRMISRRVDLLDRAYRGTKKSPEGKA